MVDVCTRNELTGKRLEDLERICGYFANNAHRMAYDQYPALGFPIASGVIEGACRCVVEDCMERSERAGCSMVHRPCWVYAAFARVACGMSYELRQQVDQPSSH